MTKSLLRRILIGFIGLVFFAAFAALTFLMIMKGESHGIVPQMLLSTIVVTWVFGMALAHIGGRYIRTGDIDTYLSECFDEHMLTRYITFGRLGSHEFAVFHEFGGPWTFPWGGIRFVLVGPAKSQPPHENPEPRLRLVSG